MTNYFPELNSQELGILLTPFDLKRLESYANNMLDYHVILDLLPTIASLFFQRRLGEEVRLTPVQSSILLALGMQRKTIEDVEVCLKRFLGLVRIKLTSLTGGAPPTCFTGSCIIHQDCPKNL